MEVNQPKRKCENCGRPAGRMAYINFNGGMVVCLPCCGEWEILGSPATETEYHRAIAGREEHRNDLIAKS